MPETNHHQQIILIHGFGCSSADWSHQIDALSAVANVVAVDLSRLDELRRRETSLILQMAGVVNEVRRRSAPSGVILVGHSMGCRVALEAAREMPASLVGISLIEGSLRATGDPAEAVRGYQSRSADENKVLLRRDFAGMFSHATPAAFQKLVLERLEEMDSELATRLVSDMTWWDAADAALALRSVEVPLLVVQSTYKEPGGERRPIKEQETSPWLRLVEEQAGARAKVIRLRNLGHFPQIEAPALVNDLLCSFIAGLPPGIDPDRI